MIHNDLEMFIIMILSGLLSSMYIWADKFSDIRLNFNDLLMISLMTGYMLFFMYLKNKNIQGIIFSLLAVIIVLFLIRTQIIINKRQYYLGMIPHHSMALLMSRRLLNNDKTLSKNEKEFIKNIIKTQEEEIKIMKKYLS